MPQENVLHNVRQSWGNFSKLCLFKLNMRKIWKFVCVDIPKEETETPILMIQTFSLENPKLVVTLCCHLACLIMHILFLCNNYINESIATTH